MSNENENENENENKSNLNVISKVFNVHEPLDPEQRALMYGEVVSTMENFHKMDDLFNKRFPEDVPDRNNSAEFLAEMIFETFKNSVVPYDGNLTNYPKETKELLKL